MNEFLTVLKAVLPVFGIMGIGLLLRRRNWLTADADQSLMRVTINLLLPALIFDSVLGNAALQRAENLLLPPLVGFGMVAVGMVVARCFTGLAGLREAREKRTFTFVAGLQNYSYLTIPLCVTLFDSGTTGVLFVHNVGTEICVWTLGIAVLSGHGFAGGLRKLISPPLIAVLLGLALNFSGNLITPPEPVLFAGKTILSAVHWLGQCAIPLALLLIGAIVADHLAEARGGGSGRVVIAAVLARQSVMPLLFLLLVLFLPCSVELKRVIVLQGAMPAAVLPIVLAKHYSGDARTAVLVALGTSLVGLATIPVWIRLGTVMGGL